MLRRGICLLAFAAPLVTLASAQGCSDAPEIEDLCSWMSSPTNCYARFADDIGTQCGEPYVVDAQPPTNATGYFVARDALDICVKNAGGQVIFDPPFDVAALTSTAPIAFSFTMLDARAATCGTGSYGGEQTFSITISTVDLNDAGVPDAGLTDHIIGGTFNIAAGEGNQFDVTCPGGEESHHFSSLWLDKCPEFAANLPRAIFDFSPGIPETDTSAGVAGFVRLRVHYPPLDPSVPASDSRVVQYFYCSIPAPPHHCDDGVQNVGETDVDCGGTCASRRRCGDGQSCLEGNDCISGVCQTVEGILQCVGP